MNRGTMNCQFLNPDEIRTLLRLPDFNGVSINGLHLPRQEQKQGNVWREMVTQDKPDFSSIPQELLRNCDSINNAHAAGDHAFFANSHQVTQINNNPKKWKILDKFQSKEDSFHRNYLFPTPNNTSKNPQSKIFASEKAPYSNLLSGYEEYLRDFCRGSNCGRLSITEQSTLSLELDSSLQIDISIDGAIRIVNPMAHIAMAVDSEGKNAALLHPMGRILQDPTSVDIMAFDVIQGCHKFAKLWTSRAIFKSLNMSFSYAMDGAGTRTSMTSFPPFPSGDISLPVFYEKSKHGSHFHEEAKKILSKAKHVQDSNGNSTWTINNIIIRHGNLGEIRVIKAEKIFMRTSPVLGHLCLDTPEIHCTASQGDQAHLFCKYGVNKMHHDTQHFKLRTMGQAAGFDENNRISLF